MLVPNPHLRIYWDLSESQSILKKLLGCHNGISHSYLGIRYRIPLLFPGINWDAPESRTLLKELLAEFPIYVWEFDTIFLC